MKRFLLLCGCTSLFAGSVTLLNDSPFKLKATILSASGENLGEATINPQHQVTWQDSYSGGQTFSETPYTVIWYCTNDKEYGIWTNVSTGALVSANGSEGPRICPTPKNQNKGTFSQN